MNASRWSKWLMIAGVVAAALGIILYTQLGWVNEVAISLNSALLLTAAEKASLAMTVCGLLAALTGGVIWARHARLGSLPVSGLAVGLLAFLLIKFVNVNMHGPTAIFTFVIPAALAMTVLFFLIAAIRLLESRRHPER